MILKVKYVELKNSILISREPSDRLILWHDGNHAIGDTVCRKKRHYVRLRERYKSKI